MKQVLFLAQGELSHILFCIDCCIGKWRFVFRSGPFNTSQVTVISCWRQEILEEYNEVDQTSS